MSAVHAEILDKISSMTVLELSELIKAMEDKFGVSAAAAVSVAAPASAGCARRAMSARKAWMLGSFVPFRYASSKAANTSATRNAISGIEAAAALFSSVSMSSNSWDSSLSSRNPQAAASPFSVCTVRRRLRAVSASPGDFSSCMASSFSFWTSSPALSKNNWWSSVIRSSGGTVTLSPLHAGTPCRCCDAPSGIFPSVPAGSRHGRQIDILEDLSNDKTSRPAVSVRLRRNTS